MKLSDKKRIEQEWIRQTIEVADSSMCRLFTDVGFYGGCVLLGDDQTPYPVLEIPDATHLVIGIHRGTTAHLN